MTNNAFTHVSLVSKTWWEEARPWFLVLRIWYLLSCTPFHLPHAIYHCHFRFAHQFCSSSILPLLLFACWFVSSCAPVFVLLHMVVFPPCLCDV
ncbi:hypothetical protein BKA82DRAFT_4134983 [Pisolithus tinctorius]|nr:hypothetical protein BKA82DRAFT_4134983 [Pisolithus tinctorius]